jgi:hypothetical protein
MKRRNKLGKELLTRTDQIEQYIPDVPAKNQMLGIIKDAKNNLLKALDNATVV